MANTYSQIYIQIVFAVKGRENLIKESFRNELEKYICGTIDNLQQKPLAIYCMPDHTHILVGLKPSMAIADLVRDIKTSATKIIKENKWVQGLFEWQVGYGAFSYSKSHLDNVIHYILNQPQHHNRKTFKEEYLEFLQKFEIEYKEEYLFEWIE
jgi:REP element-mobilizing transposase RayT